jgi:hypothetical protein
MVSKGAAKCVNVYTLVPYIAASKLEYPPSLSAAVRHAKK